MKLIRISGGLWHVFAVVDETGCCNVLDVLMSLDEGNRDEQGLASKMRALLEDWIPNQPNGPQTHNENISKLLRDKIYEFKRGQKKGPKIRVLWFYGDRRQVICTSCFLKTDKVPQNLIDNAMDLKTEFEGDLKNGKIRIVGE
jgi:hypothetical protein